MSVLIMYVELGDSVTDNKSLTVTESTRLPITWTRTLFIDIGCKNNMTYITLSPSFIWDSGTALLLPGFAPMYASLLTGWKTSCELLNSKYYKVSFRMPCDLTWQHCGQAPRVRACPWSLGWCGCRPGCPASCPPPPRSAPWPPLAPCTPRCCCQCLKQ